MNWIGVIIDFARCSHGMVKGIAQVATTPLLCAHGNLTEAGAPEGDHPHFIGPAYRWMMLVSDDVVGVWIAVLQEEKRTSMIRHMFHMIDALCINRVAIGTDLLAVVAATEMPGFAAIRILNTR